MLTPTSSFMYAILFLRIFYSGISTNNVRAAALPKTQALQHVSIPIVTPLSQVAGGGQVKPGRGGGWDGPLPWLKVTEDHQGDLI